MSNVQILPDFIISSMAFLLQNSLNITNNICHTIHLLFILFLNIYRTKNLLLIV